MTTKEMIETLRYKANNIKAKIEPEFFNEVADRLEKQVEKKAKKGTPIAAASNVLYPYKCPMCGGIISIITNEISEKLKEHGYIKHCSYCGQKVRIGGADVES